MGLRSERGGKGGGRGSGVSPGPGDRATFLNVSIVIDTIKGGASP